MRATTMKILHILERSERMTERERDYYGCKHCERHIPARIHNLKSQKRTFPKTETFLKLSKTKGFITRTNSE